MSLRKGLLNLITDVPGVLVGHAADARARSGVTTLVFESAWVAAVDVRGGGPGLRETEALAAENLFGRVHAIVLAGGSVFGLAAADGVCAGLSARGIGVRLRAGSPPIPIVPAAVLHDLGNDGDKDWGLTPPYRALGLASLQNAAATFSLGSAGAGTGAMAGLQKGGIGSASAVLDQGLIVAALVAVNCVGAVVMPDGRTFWAWAFEIDAEFGGHGAPTGPIDASEPVPHESRLRELGRLQTGANTTLGVIACNAALSNVECKRLAIMAQDGLARAIRPAHTPYDGDTVFAVAGGPWELPATEARAAQIARLGSAAADCLSRAIARAVYAAAVGVAAS
jgi:L-aminopeptidase/D-esterase-like protein